MADINILDKIKIERFFEMEQGGFLDFSKSTLADFFGETLGIDIFDEKYGKDGDSLADRIRIFLDWESNFRVSIFLSNTLEYIHNSDRKNNINWYDGKDVLFDHIKMISIKVRNNIFESFDAIPSFPNEEDLYRISTSIKQLIETDKPEEAIDRLHTYLIFFFRSYCEKYGINDVKSKPLHSLLGEYIKALKSRGLLESIMIEKILRTSISNLENINHLRNNSSFAHANRLLSYYESLFIFKTVCNLLELINNIENHPPKEPEEYDDLPF